MFFGCRYKNEDYIYQEELEEAEKNGVLTQLHVAFSRDQEQKVRLSCLIFAVPYLQYVKCTLLRGWGSDSFCWKPERCLITAKTDADCRFQRHCLVHLNFKVAGHRHSLMLII